MNFCVAILILKMEENTQHFQHIMLYYFNKGKNATETQKMICAVYGDGAVTDRTCQKWFAKFRAEDFSRDDWVHQLRLTAIEALTENTEHYTTQETANILKISKSTVIGENEKRVFYFMEKTRLTFWPTQYLAYRNLPEGTRKEVYEYAEQHYVVLF